MGNKKSRQRAPGDNIPVAEAVPVAHPVGGGGTRQNEDIHGERLVGVSIRSCDLFNCTVENCTINGADIVGSQVFGGNLKKVDIKGGSVVERAQIKETDLFDCTLNNTDVHTFDVKGTVTVNGGKLSWGEVKPGGQIINNGGIICSDVDNYTPHAATGYPQADYAPTGYPPTGYAPTGGGVPPGAPNPYGCQPSAPPATGYGYPPQDGARGAEGTTDDEGAPNRFLCPITMEVMNDPVMSRTGHNFERSAILHWLSQNSHCPQTRQSLSPEDLSPNRALKEEIAEWRHNKLTAKPNASGPLTSE